MENLQELTIKYKSLQKYNLGYWLLFTQQIKIS